MMEDQKTEREATIHTHSFSLTLYIRRVSLRREPRMMSERMKSGGLSLVHTSSPPSRLVPRLGTGGSVATEGERRGVRSEGLE